MKYKRILYVRTDITHKPLIAGGSVTHTLGVINGLKQLGYRVICASSVMLDQLKTMDLDGVYELKNPRLVHWLRWRINCVLSNIFFTKKIITILKKHPCDYIYQRYSIFNCAGVWASKKANVPLILEYNGSEIWIDHHWSPKKFFKVHWLARFIEDYTLASADTILVISEVLRQELIDRGIREEKILVNPNGVDTETFNPAILSDSRISIRESLGIQDKIVFGFVGTFSAWHGIEMLAKIVPAIVAQRSNAHFLFMGDGPLLDFLKSAIEESNASGHVTFTGMLAPKQLKSYSAACDIFLCPNQPNPDGTEFFGSPTKLFEYMSMAKPIIASDIASVSQVIYPALSRENLLKESVVDQVGILINPHDETGFIASALYLIDANPLVRNALGDNARAKAERQYRWQDHVKKIVEFVEQ